MPVAGWTGHEGGGAASPVPSETARESGAAARWEAGARMQGLRSAGCHVTGQRAG